MKCISSCVVPEGWSFWGICLIEIYGNQNQYNIIGQDGFKVLPMKVD